MATSDLSEQLVEALTGVYGVHAGARVAHAKGVLCHATFTPTPAASALSAAPHLAAPSSRAHVRFSNGGGNPTIADSERDPRGMALKVYLDDGRTTDIVGISLPTFFARTPEDLLAFNRARRPDPETGELNMEVVGAYLGEHPEAMTAVMAAVGHPVPASYAGLTYRALHAYGFVDAGGAVRHGRYVFVPDEVERGLTDEEIAECGPDHLREELEQRLADGPARFTLQIQLAAADDDVDDPTVAWPDDREVIDAGHLDVTGFADDRERDGDILVFDPTRVVEGIELTNDQILLARPGAYALSVARRTGAN